MTVFVVIAFLFCIQQLNGQTIETSSIECDADHHPARYPGGMQAMQQFFQDHLVVPPEPGMCPSGMASPGRCFLRFTVEVTGEITNIVVLHGIPDCPACDEEILRVIRLMPKWEPETTGTRTIRSTVNLPVTFGIR
jgi:periplasmic protein TonB